MRKEKGFSLIELLIVVAIILIIVAIAIPNLLKARISANEASAAEGVRSIVTATVVYNSTWNNGYPPDMASLGGVGPIFTCDFSGLVDQTITSAPNQKSGYQYAYNVFGAPLSAPAPGCAVAGYWQYLATAAPLYINSSGNRAFCSDQPGIIHVADTGVAPASVAACEALPTLQ